MMVCYPCPNNCLDCNINIIINEYPDLDCGNDDYCSDGIICTSCSTGFEIVAGKCVSVDECKEYSYPSEN